MLQGCTLKILRDLDVLYLFIIVLKSLAGMYVCVCVYVGLIVSVHSAVTSQAYYPSANYILRY